MYVNSTAGVKDTTQADESLSGTVDEGEKKRQVIYCQGSKAIKFPY